MLVSSRPEYLTFDGSDDIAFVHRTTEAAWSALRFAIDDEASEEAEFLRQRLRSEILRAVEMGERNATRIVDAVLADLPPMPARYGAGG